MGEMHLGVHTWIALLAKLYFSSAPDTKWGSDVWWRGWPPPDIGWVYSTVARRSVAMILEFSCRVPRQSLPFSGWESASVFRLGIYNRFSVGNLQSCHVTEKRLEFPIRKTDGESCPKTGCLEPNMAASLPRRINNTTPRFGQV